MADGKKSLWRRLVEIEQTVGPFVAGSMAQQAGQQTATTATAASKGAIEKFSGWLKSRAPSLSSEDETKWANLCESLKMNMEETNNLAVFLKYIEKEQGYDVDVFRVHLVGLSPEAQKTAMMKMVYGPSGKPVPAAKRRRGTTSAVPDLVPEQMEEVLESLGGLTAEDEQAWEDSLQKLNVTPEQTSSLKKFLEYVGNEYGVFVDLLCLNILNMAEKAQKTALGKMIYGVTGWPKRKRKTVPDLSTDQMKEVLENLNQMTPEDDQAWEDVLRKASLVAPEVTNLQRFLDYVDAEYTPCSNQLRFYIVDQSDAVEKAILEKMVYGPEGKPIEVPPVPGMDQQLIQDVLKNFQTEKLIWKKKSSMKKVWLFVTEYTFASVLIGLTSLGLLIILLRDWLRVIMR